MKKTRKELKIELLKYFKGKITPYKEKKIIEIGDKLKSLSTFSEKKKEHNSGFKKSVIP